MLRKCAISPWSKVIFGRALCTTQTYFTSQGVQEKEGYPMCIASVGAFPLAPDVHREDVFRCFGKYNIAREDIIVQYSPWFNPICWWIRFHAEDDRAKALSIVDIQFGGRRVKLEERSMEDWRSGTYNHLVGKSMGSAILLSRLAIDTTPEDISSFFRNFHLQGNGVMLLQDPFRPNVMEENQFRRAIVKLVSKQEAQRAARALHRKTLRSNMVNVRVLQ